MEGKPKKENKVPKERAKNYDPKLSVKIGFEETVKLALKFNPKKAKGK